MAFSENFYLKEFDFKPEEFIVEEISSDGTIFEAGKTFDLGKPGDRLLERDYFTHFVLQKRAWNSPQALLALAKFLHVKPSRFNFAGTKDRNAITTQLCSVFALPPERLLGANGRIRDLQINGAWKAAGKVRLGALGGNRFTITLSKENCGITPIASRIKVRAFSSNFMFPNFFGSQRFGSLRRNTAEVGRLVLQGDFKSAVFNYLTFAEGERDGESVAARKRLAAEGDFAEALGYFPRHLKYERLLLEHLAENPNDFVGALQRLPRSLLLMFVHAFQSRLFNVLLDERLAAGGAWGLEEKGKLIGSDSALSDGEKMLLERLGLSTESFRLKSLGFLSSKGSERNFSAELKNFEVLSENPVVLRFSLDSGCYATVALNWLLSD